MCIGDMFGFGGGDDGPVGYTSPYVKEYEKGARDWLGSRAGAKKTPKTDAQGKPVTDSQGNPVYDWDYSDTGAPMGVDEAKKPYSFGQFDEAAKKMGDYSTFDEEYKSGYDPKAFKSAYEGTEYKSSYDPKEFKSGYERGQYDKTDFDFETLPEEYGNLAYQRGAKDIRREGAGQLESLKEAVGTRRPGLLLKAGQDAQRGQRESLADLTSDIRRDVMAKSTDLKVDQAKSQAAENYKKAGFDEDTARRMADEKYQEAAFGEDQEKFKAGETLGEAQFAEDVAKFKAGEQRSDAEFGEDQARFKAGEGYKGYTSRADRERARADERWRRDTGGLDAAGRRIGYERGVTGDERAYKDKAMDWLAQLFGLGAGVTSDSARAGRQSADTRRGQSLDFLSSFLPF